MSAQVLKLTGVVEPTDMPNVFIGYIKEISGIITQGGSREEVYADLEEITGYMLEYKREEALALLAEQTHKPAPSVKRMAEVPYEIAHAALA
ncbi:hypothetical protein AUC43_03075 [Hymenobacter sedentarius]|uniref:Uncharacterized protein n=1 Tax=Hymenobacter sedentarius TaxID=1411621 RepID=A0A0U4C7M2_9BACT|nr:hypothetical protein [Hymenobacter sedentarius]ALW84169.1 hypothetical protein AUC43_03075 [Hymenobacter sedentarius]